MSVAACADAVARGDRDRFMAAMAARPKARAVLFPLYAFNLEVARAPWRASEPMIAEMRLQWWRDALGEIEAGGVVRAHEVTTPLAGLLDAEGARILDKLVVARRWDVYRDPFEDAAHFEDYLDASSAGLFWVAARALGSDREAEVRNIGWAAGLAAYLVAVPELEARGRVPLVDGRPEAVAALAQAGLERLGDGRADRAAGPALLSAWQARGILERAARAPGRVAEGRLLASEFRRRVGLMWWSLVR